LIARGPIFIRLGKKADPNIADERAALAYGANQFKVNFQKLREVFSEREFARYFAYLPCPIL
jgi:hypothetical protein